MKKTTHIRNIVAIAAITLFTACKKEIYKPMNDANAKFKAVPAAQAINLAAMAKTKGNGYTGTTTLGDSTKTGVQP